MYLFSNNFVGNRFFFLPWEDFLAFETFSRKFSCFSHLAGEVQLEEKTKGKFSNFETIV